MNRLVWIAMVVLMALSGNRALFAQHGVVNAGDVKQVRIGKDQVSFTTTHAYVQISVYNDSVIRVRMDRQPLGDDFSYAVVARPSSVAAVIREVGEQISITTRLIQARISKRPFSISFYTPDGKPINEEENGLTTSWVDNTVTAYRKMQPEERFIGLGEKNGPLDRTGNAYTNWNSDVFGYRTDQDPLYSTIPFYIGIHHGLEYGIFLDNTYQSDFNFGASNNRFSSFAARGGEMNYYFIHAPSVAGIIQAYTGLTGRMHMPPLWSLGYQQNRYSYYPDQEVLRIAQTLREKKIPADGITLDIHYMDAYKLFTWDKDRFPDPAGLVSKLKQQGFELTVINDPGIKVEKGYAAYESGVQDNVFIKYVDGQLYTGQVWPGWCHFPDFTNEQGREWWKRQLRSYVDVGVAGFWNDMNEIATWGQKMPDNVLFDFDGHGTTHRQVHNVYALEMVRASYEGARAAMHKRPFILTRAGYAGLQRYSAIWTGDNRAEDDHMLAGVRIMNSLGLSGVAFTGMDIGGFTGNASVGLYTRWMQVGAFLPYFRNHTAVNTRSAEPWAFGEEALEVSRNYINLRYRLLPYIYSVFYEAIEKGLPVMRSLAINYTDDARVYDSRFQQQFQLGDAFMIAPFESNQQYGAIYFPAGGWYDLYTDEQVAGGQIKVNTLGMHELPVYVKAGSIVPMQSLVQTTAERPGDTLYLHVYKGDTANAITYYEDDGQTYDYEKGVYYKRVIRYDGGLIFDKVEGSYTSKFNNISLIFHGLGQLQQVKVNGSVQSLQSSRISFLSPISRFDPQGGYATTAVCRVQALSIKNSADRIVVEF
ncbi:glycoside hydrolase family 31 protein [Chitinophaga sancti]|uniref:Alpha-glucosidase n=1 Tax=Chitinophaga sancti TaxID=1004 RepID=A0A1K1NYJ6_9BACT|nr:TIM-barrel domain-containing protein [Chitinophaga sancti]WQD60301.1 glycoside hydrolase family 31 protein [Chitinophaga sancti]WQG87571.1 glycoside hydrolase family 31 protein [Chitinophaga sancti]SFW40315.1 alpha-glucosidase [Chitinophaga sancti]